MKTLIQRLQGQTPYFFRIIARVSTMGIAFFGMLLGLNASQFGPLPPWVHSISTHGGAICTAIVFICHLVVVDEPKDNSATNSPTQ